MKILLVKFYSLKLRSKFMFSYTVIILFTALMISVVSYKVSESALKNNTSRFSEYLMDQISKNLESHTREVEDFIFVHFNNSGLSRYLRIADNNENQVSLYQKQRNLNSFLFNLGNSKQYIKLVMLIDVYGKEHHYDRSGMNIDIESLGKSIDMEYLKGLWGSSVWKQESNGLIYIQRAIYDPQTTEYVGVLTVGIDESYLNKLYSNIDRVEGGGIIILDHKNDILASTDNLSYKIASYLTNKGLFERNKGNDSFSYDNKEYISTLQLSPNGKWKVLNIISVKELTKSSDTLKLWTLLTCALAILIALLIAVLISGNITENIRLLIRNIKKISEGNFNTRIQPKSYDEVGMLAEEFNHMSEKINNLINTVYHEQLLKKNAEFKALQFEYNALQAQINPHFLYNTLESINSMAKLKGEEDISEMVYLLGNLLRESISKKSNIISLKEEIQYIRNYLKIQKMTYGDKIEVDYKIDESLLNAKVPKFILQPVVENAIIHGIEEKPGKGFISIKCLKDEKDIALEVEDNGVGIDVESYKKLFKDGNEAEDKDSRHTKVGVKSVDKRIKILYGNSYGLNIVSEKGKGTKVKILIPFVEQAETVQAEDKGGVDINAS